MMYFMLLSSLDQFSVISSRFWLAGHSKPFVYDVVHILENVGIPGRISTEFSFVWERVCVSVNVYMCESVWVWECVNLWECMWECAGTYVCGVVCMHVLIGSWYVAQTVCKLGILGLPSSWIRRTPPPLEAGCFQILGFHPWVWVLELWNYINPSLRRKPRVESTCLVFYLKGEQFEYGFLAFQCNTKKQSLAPPFST